MPLMLMVLPLSPRAAQMILPLPQILIPQYSLPDSPQMQAQSSAGQPMTQHWSPVTLPQSDSRLHITPAIQSPPHQTETSHSLWLTQLPMPTSPLPLQQMLPDSQHSPGQTVAAPLI